MTSQRDYAQISLRAVFDMTGSKISRFQTAKAWGRKIEIEKQFLIFMSGCHLDSIWQIKKICHTRFKSFDDRFRKNGTHCREATS